jgi:hypothetical protein
MFSNLPVHILTDFYQKVYGIYLVTSNRIKGAKTGSKSKRTGIETICQLFHPKVVDDDPSVAMKSAYHALLIGKLVEVYPHLKPEIKAYLPEKSFDRVIELIQDFAVYHDALNATDESKNTTKRSLDSILSLLLS